MKLQLLPSTFDDDGSASSRQHLLTVIVDDSVAIDAGCLAWSCSEVQRRKVRDIVLTHPHLDHIAGLPLFIDDLFASLEEPIRIHATREMIDILERDVFNWAIYPRFSELKNEKTSVIEYVEFERGGDFRVRHLDLRSVAVNHKISANGYVISDGSVSVAITGDTAETDDIWPICNQRKDLKALLIECAFPDEMSELAVASHHLSPLRLKEELRKFDRDDVPVYIINIKPMYRDQVLAQLEAVNIPNAQILEIGRVYEF